MAYIIRLELTEQENDFYRRILYRVTSDPKFGQPYLKRAFYRLIPVSVMGSQTMSVDEFWRVYIDFAEMMRRGVEYAAGIMNHEIWHLLRSHHDRAKSLPSAPVGYNKNLLWNIAGDLEINDDIADLLPLYLIKPGQSTFREYPENLTMEKNYDLLLADLPNVADNFPIQYKDRPQQNKSSEQNEEGSQEDTENNSSSDEENQESSESDQSDGTENSDSSDNEDDDSEDSQNGDESESDSSDSSDDGDQSEDSPGNDSNEGDESSSEDDPADGDEAGEDSQEGDESENSESDEGLDSGEAESEESSGQGEKEGSSPQKKKAPAFPTNHRSQPQDAWGGSGNSESSSSDSSSSGSGEGSGSGSGSSSDSYPVMTGDTSGGSGSDGDDENSDEPYDFWKNPQCGSAAGNEKEYELPENATEQMTNLEEEVLLHKIAKDIEAFAKEQQLSSKNVGSGASNRFNKISEWANQKLKAKPVPWKQEFRGHFRASYGQVSGKMIYVRNRPNRRQPIPEIMYPALRSPKPTVGLAIDVSGSNVPNLQLILVEVMNIMKAAGARGREVKAFAVDVAASVEKYVNDPMTLLDDLPSGGGTAMTPGYEKLAELGQDISILITDGYVDDYPKVQPKGKKHTKFITCIVASERDTDLEKRLKTARKYVGSWSVVLPLIALNENQPSAF